MISGIYAVSLNRLPDFNRECPHNFFKTLFNPMAGQLVDTSFIFDFNPLHLSLKQNYHVIPLSTIGNLLITN